VNIFVILSPYNYIACYELIIKKNLSNILIVNVNFLKYKSPFANYFLFKNKIKHNYITINTEISFSLVKIILFIFTIIKLIFFRFTLFNCNTNSHNTIYFGDYRYRFKDLLIFMFKVNKVSIIDDGLDSLFFYKDSKNFGFKKLYYKNFFKRDFENNLVLDKNFFKNDYYNKNNYAHILNKNNKYYKKIILGSAINGLLVTNEEYALIIKKLFLEFRIDKAYYFPHRREELKYLLKIPKLEIINTQNIDRTFELFFYFLKKKPKVIFTFPGTTLMGVYKINMKQNINLLDLNHYTKKKIKYYDFSNRLDYFYYLQKKILNINFLKF